MTKGAELTVQGRAAIGAMGAICPEIVRWYRLITSGAELPEIAPWYLYVSISVAFVAVAAGFTTLWDESNKVKCFYLGLSFPTFVSFMVAQVPKVPW